MGGKLNINIVSWRTRQQEYGTKNQPGGLFNFMGINAYANL